jgi:ABC-type sugar transport system ATPase subunit
VTLAQEIDVERAPSGGGVLLSAEDVHKSYGGVYALRGAALHVRRGEVHALVGENGSGKSTLLKVLSGQVMPDRGDLRLDGRPLRLADPVAALGSGIATVTQETTLVPELSVAENILLGRRLVRGRFGLNWSATRRRAQEVLERLGLDLDPDAAVVRLRPDQQQLVEIARALSVDARLLVLDESTSSLTDDEVEHLFRIVRDLRHHDVAVLFVSHRMNEVRAISDAVTVLRDGRTVATGPTSEFGHARLVHAMIGRELEAYVHAEAAGDDAVTGRPLLRLRDITVPGRVDRVSLDVAEREIVGLAGLVGAGRTELFEAAFGLRDDATGTVEVDGVDVAPSHPQDAMRAGLAYVPAERKVDGLVLGMSIRENLMMARTAGTPRVAPPPAREATICDELVARLRIVGAPPSAPVGALSGGNQQKVVLGKWLGTAPKVLLLNEPTRGVDVGAKAEIYRLLDGARERGLSILLSSSEVPELLLLCDRIVVLHRGRVAAVLRREQATEARIASYAMGHSG